MRRRSPFAVAWPRRFPFALCLACWVLLALGLVWPGAVMAQSASGYRLATGDKIAIDVYGEEELTINEVLLTDTGLIRYPFLGELKLTGLTIGQVEKRITEGLDGDYLVDPKVTVRIIEYRPFYVNGEVEKPGGYPYQPGLTVYKAVSLAGGLTERASQTKMELIREGTKLPVPVKLDDSVGPGDVITIHQSFF